MGNYQESGLTFVKFGTNTLVGDDGIDHSYLDTVAQQVALVHAEGKNIAIVSSGARTVGLQTLGEEADAEEMFRRGQQQLVNAWRTALEGHGLTIAEHLISEMDVQENPIKVLDQINESLARGSVPVVNGHDAKNVGVSQTPLTGENDSLTAWIAVGLAASAVFLTTPPGVLDQKGRVIPWIENPNEITLFNHTSKNGRGGMSLKVHAASRVAENGQQSIIAGSREPDVIVRFSQRKNGFGTRFAPQAMVYSKI